MKRPRWTGASFLLVLACTTQGQHLDITTYYPKDGVSVVGANSVSQDRNGWIWLTDGYKVMRYDGHRFKSFYPVANHKMNYNFGTIEVGREIWVKATPRPFKVDRDSLIPIDGTEHAPDIIHALEHQGKQYVLEKNGLFILIDGKLQESIMDSSLLLSDYAKLIPYADTLLVTYELKKGLVIFDLKHHKLYRVYLPVFDLKKSPNGALYALLKEKGLFQVNSLSRNGNDWKADFELFCQFDYNEKHYGNFIIDRKGNFWLFEQLRWLVKITPEKKISTYTEANGLPGVWFFNIMADKEDNIWLTVHGAVAKISQTPFERYTQEEGLYLNHISFIRARDPDRIFIGTAKGLNAYVKEKLYRVRYGVNPFLCSDIIYEKGRIHYTRDSSFFTAILDTMNHTVHSEKRLVHFKGVCIELLDDMKGNIFIATTRGVYTWKKNVLTSLLPDTTYYRKIFIDAQNRFWAGTFSGGLSCYEINYTNGLPTLKPIQSINDDSLIKKVFATRSLAQDNGGNILAGTRYNGVFYFHMKGNTIEKSENFQAADGLGSNAIWSLEKEQGGNIWIANDFGLNKLLIENGKPMLDEEYKYRQLFFTYQIAFDGRHHLWICSFPGILKFDISEKRSPHPFTVFVTGISAEGKNIPIEELNRQPRFDYRHNTFSIEFSSNSFLDEKSIAYSYRLLKDGNENWSAPSTAHLVNYSSLLPGSYTFEVRAFNTAGNWSENTASFSFAITPPIWQQTWFVVLAILLFLFLVSLAYRYRIAQILRLQQMRNNISRNLHDDIGASLSNINILSELAKRNIDEPSKAKGYLQQAGEDIQQISESLSDIVWNINPRYDQIGNLYARMKRYAADMLDGRQIEADIVFPDESNIQLPMEKRRDFYLIFKEAVNNLVKYSGASKALVEVKSGNSKIILRIEDNGVGFHINDGRSGNGLHNMHERAKKWNSSLNIFSEPGKGTRVILEMKA